MGLSCQHLAAIGSDTGRWEGVMVPQTFTMYTPESPDGVQLEVCGQPEAGCFREPQMGCKSIF